MVAPFFFTKKYTIFQHHDLATGHIIHHDSDALRLINFKPYGRSWIEWVRGRPGDFNPRTGSGEGNRTVQLPDPANGLFHDRVHPIATILGIQPDLFIHGETGLSNVHEVGLPKVRTWGW